jgi:hypothetical protein
MAEDVVKLRRSCISRTFFFVENPSSPTRTAKRTSVCRVMNAGEAAARYGPPKEIRVETPQQIMDIRRDVVDSGVIKLPGKFFF